MTAVYFAGGEVETLTRALLDNGVKRILYSYYYVYKMRREGFIARMQDEYRDVEWFLDSGAFTYIVKSRTDKASLPPWKAYRKLYFTYVRDTWERWARVMELDLDHLEGVSFDDLMEWRDEMLETCGPGLNLCPVWHPGRGAAEWTAYCRDPRFRHLALGAGHYSRYSGSGRVRRMVMEAHNWNKTVHGLGMTGVNTALRVIPYDTVDSTSWLMGQKFGTLFVFQNNKFRLIGKDGSMGKRERMLYRSHFKAIGVDWRKIEADDGAEVRRANIIAWRRLSDRLEEMRKRQGRSLLGGRDLASDYVWDSPRQREGAEVGLDHAGPKEREVTSSGGSAEESARHPRER